MPPEPTGFSIPSVRDDVDLECRIYHPTRFHNSDHSSSLVWARKGAIFAHPYGPMGGCFDDPIVCSVVSVLLKAGYVVGTFNFRGAGGSKGRTSWTGKPETEDYMSFIAFFVHYLHALRPDLGSFTEGSSIFPRLSTIQSEVHISKPSSDDSATMLLLGGYSYGSLITINLPKIDEIMSKFAYVTKGTAAAEIRLRAAHMSGQWNAEVRETQRGRNLTAGISPRSPSILKFGGEESEPGTRRLSRDSRRSVDFVRRSVDVSRKRISIGRQRSRDSVHAPSTPDELEYVEIPTPHTCFILISPLLPPISSFATMFSGHFSSGKRNNHKGDGQNNAEPNKLSRHPTLAVYGDKDYFTAAKKLRKWAENLTEESDSKFQYHEVEGAGHFWHEEGVNSKMRSILRDWAIGIGHG